MNDIFNPQRFWFLFRKTIFERRILWLGLIVLSFVISWLKYVNSVPVKIDNEHFINENWIYFQHDAFSIGFIFTGNILAAMLFDYFSDSAQGANYLTLPASYIEKWLCGVIIMILFMLVFHIFFRLMDTYYVNRYYAMVDMLQENKERWRNLAYLMPYSLKNMRFIYILSFSSMSIMALGALYFNKLSIVKTGVVIVVVFLILQFLNGTSAYSLFKQEVGINIFRTSIYLTKSEESVYLRADISNIFNAIYLFFIPSILWLITLIRLREKEF
jgi:hypothetical protein